MDSVTLFVNGQEREVTAPPQQPLLWVLRDELQLTGTKYGCGEGQCGGCTVLLDGKAVRSCITPLSAAAGKKVTTIESLRDNSLHAVRQAFIRAEAFECGYCTSGMILSAAAFLSTNRSPSNEAIMKALNGNICRCGTYPRIMAAVRDAAEVAQKAKEIMDSDLDIQFANELRQHEVDVGPHVLIWSAVISAAIVVMSTTGYKLLFDFPPPILLAVVVIGYVASVLTLIALWFLPRVWQLQAWRFGRKLRHGLALALMVWTIVLLIEWKVLLAPLML